MRPSLVIVLVIISVQQLSVKAEPGNFFDTLGSVIIQSLTQNEVIQFGRYDCRYTVNPKLEGFQLYYSGAFTCPELSPITGRGRGRGRSSTLNASTNDFALKVIAAGLFTAEEIKQWLAVT